jgi:ArsR family transcriptional regulator
MNKTEVFDNQLQELARFGKAISHPARLSILKYLAETKTCISGDISDSLPLSRSTVSQHLKELKAIGLIHGDIDGLKINYCLCTSAIAKYRILMNDFLVQMESQEMKCCKQKVL